MTAHYDDPAYSYAGYWQNRGYEHSAEIIAIRRLLTSCHFPALVDIGGGFGRLIPTLARYGSHLTLLEPSAKLRSQARKYLADLPRITVVSGTAEHTRLPAQSQNLAVIIRVFHHLPNLNPVFVELNRIIAPSGFVLFEFANSLHIKSQIKSLLTGTPILLTPLERRSPANIRRGTIDFVNHHPHTILKLLHQAGFTPIKILSVSNFRSPALKKTLPLKLLLILEEICQPLLSRLYFGPSIFILAQKNPSPSPSV